MICQTHALMFNLIEERIAMKKNGIVIPNLRQKPDGTLAPIDKAPKHAKIAKRNKADRAAKKWAAAARKTT